MTETRWKSDGDGVRADAYELFMAEAARIRLQDRSGSVRIMLCNGHTLTGCLDPAPQEAIEGHLVLTGADGEALIVALQAISAVVGAASGLRDEDHRSRPATLASRLRECWRLGVRLRVLLGDGRWLGGDVVLIGADHAELLADGERWVVPFGAAQAWVLPG